MKHVLRIAAQYTGADKEEWQAVAKTFRLPYLDWWVDACTCWFCTCKCTNRQQAAGAGCGLGGHAVQRRSVPSRRRQLGEQPSLLKGTVCQ